MMTRDEFRMIPARDVAPREVARIRAELRGRGRTMHATPWFVNGFEEGYQIVLLAHGGGTFSDLIEVDPLETFEDRLRRRVALMERRLEGMGV
jgi:hypothetical protein